MEATLEGTSYKPSLRTQSGTSFIQFYPKLSQEVFFWGCEKKFHLGNHVPNYN